MRPVRVAVVVAFLLCPTTLPAQQSAQFGVSDSAAIKQLFDRYNRAFSKKDYRQLRDELQAPFLRFAAGVESLPTLDDVIEFYETLRGPLDQQGYERSELVDSRITALGTDRAIVSGLYRRYREDGTVLVEASAVYLVSKSSGKWKICGVSPQDRDLFGKVY